MRKQATCFLLTIFFFICHSSGQTNNQKDSIVGIWTLVRYDQDGKPMPNVVRFNKVSYRFAADGTFSFFKGSKMTEKGKWKMDSLKTGISVYEITPVPYTSNFIIADHNLPIVSITKCNLAIKEFLYTEANRGNAYYKRVSPKLNCE